MFYLSEEGSACWKYHIEIHSFVGTAHSSKEGTVVKGILQNLNIGG